MSLEISDQSPDMFADPIPGWGFRPAEAGGTAHVTYCGLWSALRWAVDQLDGKSLEKALAIARGVRKSLEPTDHWGRAALCFAFARDVEASAEEAKRDWKSAPDAALFMILGSPDAETAMQVWKAIETWRWPGLGDVAFDLVEQFGTDSAALLDLGLAWAKKLKKGKEDRAPIEEAIALLKAGTKALPDRP
jgi:hypothetical protein